MTEIVLIAHDIRSCHNVGSLFRTAEGLGVGQIFLTGYTPYPETAADTRLPHIAQKITKDIHKTALDAEQQVPWQQRDNVESLLTELKTRGYTLYALEQTTDSIPLPTLQVNNKVAILLGREVEGIDPTLLKLCDHTVEIPMFGKKESFNVVQAAAMVLYHVRFLS